MSRILKSHPKSVQAHKDLVLQCLDDKDESIRLRALDLLYGMVSAEFKYVRCFMAAVELIVYGFVRPERALLYDMQMENNAHMYTTHLHD